jgi:hypothetical protein
MNNDTLRCFVKEDLHYEFCEGSDERRESKRKGRGEEGTNERCKP